MFAFIILSLFLAMALSNREDVLWFMEKHFNAFDFYPKNSVLDAMDCDVFCIGCDGTYMETTEKWRSVAYKELEVVSVRSRLAIRVLGRCGGSTR